MENVILKNFLDNFKQFIVDECEKEVGTASSYRSNVKRACEILNLGEGFLEAIAVIADARVKAALCEFLRAKLSEVIEVGSSSVPKKSIIDCRSAVTKLGEFVVFEESYEEVETVETSGNNVNDGTQIAVLTAPATVFHPVVTLPYESTYTQKDILKKFKSRLSTQDRFYSDGCFPTHLITKINAKRRQLYDIQVSIVSRLMPRYAHISLVEYQRSGISIILDIFNLLVSKLSYKISITQNY